MAAALAFYGLFSLFPLLLLTAAGAAFVVPADEARRTAERLAAAYAPWVREQILFSVDQVFASRRGLGLTGLLGLSWSASHVFAGLARALDRVWPAEGRQAFWRARLLGVLAAAASAAALAMSLVAATALALVAGRNLPGDGLGDRPGWTGLAEAAALLLGFTAITALYRLLPAAPPDVGDARRGALVALVLMYAARFGLSWLVGGLARASLVYGALTAALATLAWLYATFAALLLGAEFAAANARRRGCRCGP